MKKIKSQTRAILDEYFNQDYLLFVFGSLAKNTMDLASDIDLAVYSRESLPASKMAGIRDELENKVPTLRGIDLVNLNENINGKLLENILKEGVLWKKGKNSRELLKDLKKRLRNLKR